MLKIEMCRRKTTRGDIRGEKARRHGSRSGFAPWESPSFVSLSSPRMALLLQSPARPHGTNRPQGLFLEMQTRDEMGGFPGGAVVENLPANAGDTGSSPGLGRSHMPRSN